MVSMTHKKIPLLAHMHTFPHAFFTISILTSLNRRARGRVHALVHADMDAFDLSRATSQTNHQTLNQDPRPGHRPSCRKNQVVEKTDLLNHPLAACIQADWSNGLAQISAGPLDQLSGRLFGRILPNNVSRVPMQTVSLTEQALGNEHLSFFMSAATGQPALTLVDAVCERRGGAMRPPAGTAAPGWYVVGELVCTGRADVWGFSQTPIAAIILEVSNVPLVDQAQQGSQTQLHIGLYTVRRTVGGGGALDASWSPFESGGMSMFGGIASDSWVKSLRFSPGSGGVEEVVVSASTLRMQHSRCTFCGAPLQGFDGWTEPFPGAGSPSSSTVEMLRGVEIIAKGASLRPQSGQDDSFSLFGSEVYVEGVNTGNVRIAMRMYLDVPGCLWPSAEEIAWEVVVNNRIIVRPLDTVESTTPVRFQGTSVVSRPAITAVTMLRFSLSENRAFTAESSFDATPPAAEATQVSIPLLLCLGFKVEG